MLGPVRSTVYVRKNVVALRSCIISVSPIYSDFKAMYMMKERFISHFIAFPPSLLLTLSLAPVYCIFSFTYRSDNSAHTRHHGVLIANYRIDLELSRQLSVWNHSAYQWAMGEEREKKKKVKICSCSTFLIFFIVRLFWCQYLGDLCVCGGGGISRSLLCWFPSLITGNQRPFI